MSKPDDVAYYYHGVEGEYIQGVPAQNLTYADMERLEPLQRKDVRDVQVVRGVGTIPLYSTDRAKPKPTEPEPVAPDDSPDTNPPDEGKKG